MKSVYENLSLLNSIAKGIALQFGENCEVVIHDYQQPIEHTIVHIENGHVTGRKVGQSGTDIGLRILKGDEHAEGKYNYLTTTPKGRYLRSSTIYINDDNGKVIGSLCINFDISDLIVAGNIINSFVNADMAEPKNVMLQQAATTTVFNEIEDMLANLIDASIKHVGVPVAHMTREQKVQGIKYLDKCGAFLIKKAGQKVAECYGISKCTAYNYLNE